MDGRGHDHGHGHDARHRSCSVEEERWIDLYDTAGRRYGSHGHAGMWDAHGKGNPYGGDRWVHKVWRRNVGCDGSVGDAEHDGDVDGDAAEGDSEPVGEWMVVPWDDDDDVGDEDAWAVGCTVYGMKVHDEQEGKRVLCIRR